MNAASSEALSDSWDSIHVFEVSERGRQAHYKLTSTVMLQLVTRRSTDPETEAVGVSSAGPGDKRGERWKRNGEIVLSGNMTRQVSASMHCLRASRPCKMLTTFPGMTGGARLAAARRLITHHQHGPYGRGDGDQDAEPFARGGYLDRCPITAASSHCPACHTGVFWQDS